MNTLGLEVGADLDMGFMRWLTVRVPGDAGREIFLELPGPPGMDPVSGDMVRELVTKGATGFCFGLTTDDCQKSYEEMSARGVVFTEPPQQQMYGIDCGFRDPSGNNLRLSQLDESFGR